jgi:hypothetical protein
MKYNQRLLMANIDPIAQSALDLLSYPSSLPVFEAIGKIEAVASEDYSKL